MEGFQNIVNAFLHFSLKTEIVFWYCFPSHNHRFVIHFYSKRNILIRTTIQQDFAKSNFAMDDSDNFFLYAREVFSIGPTNYPNIGCQLKRVVMEEIVRNPEASSGIRTREP